MGGENEGLPERYIQVHPAAHNPRCVLCRYRSQASPLLCILSVVVHSGTQLIVLSFSRQLCVLPWSSGALDIKEVPRVRWRPLLSCSWLLHRDFGNIHMEHRHATSIFWTAECLGGSARHVLFTFVACVRQLQYCAIILPLVVCD